MYPSPQPWSDQQPQPHHISTMLHSHHSPNLTVMTTNLRTKTRSLVKSLRTKTHRCYLATFCILSTAMYLMCSANDDINIFALRSNLWRQQTTHGTSFKTGMHPPSYSLIHPLTHPLIPSTPLPFTTPQILTFYTRPYNLSHTDIYIYTSGISLGTFRRNITIIGCVIGNHVYPRNSSAFDVTHCRMDRVPKRHERVTVMLLNDDVLRDAMLYKEIQLDYGLKVTLEKDVIVDLIDVELHLPTSFRKQVFNDGVKVVDTDLRWKHHPVDAPLWDGQGRYEVCLVTQISSFGELLPDWISYHRSIGVDMVYIYDNNAKKIPHSVTDRDDVEMIYWPWERSQVQCLSYALHSARGRCEWVLALDVDEYLMSPSGSLKEYLQQARGKGWNQIMFKYKTMTGNRVNKSLDPLALSYTTTSKVETDNGKSICYTDFGWVKHGVHRCGAGFFNRHVSREHTSGGLRTVHYKFRSLEEYLIKREMGSGSVIDGMLIGTGTKEVWWENKGKEWTTFKEIWKKGEGDRRRKRGRSVVWRENGKQMRVDVT